MGSRKTLQSRNGKAFRSRRLSLLVETRKYRPPWLPVGASLSLARVSYWLESGTGSSTGHLGGLVLCQRDVFPEAKCPIPAYRQGGQRNAETRAGSCAADFHSRIEMRLAWKRFERWGDQALIHRRSGWTGRATTAELIRLKRHKFPDAHRRPARHPLHCVRQTIIPIRSIQLRHC